MAVSRSGEVTLLDGWGQAMDDGDGLIVTLRIRQLKVCIHHSDVTLDVEETVEG